MTTTCNGGEETFMSTIIVKNDCSGTYDKCENTYFYFNGAILVLHHWAGQGGDDENPYMVDQWSVYHDTLDGRMDLHISWNTYESGYIDVHSVDYPDGFDIQELKKFLDYELGIEMPTSKK